MIQGIVFIIFLVFLVLEYKKNPQWYLLVTLVALVLVGVTRVMFYHVDNVVIQAIFLSVTLIFCGVSFYLIQKREK